MAPQNAKFSTAQTRLGTVSKLSLRLGAPRVNADCAWPLPDTKRTAMMATMGINDASLLKRNSPSRDEGSARVPRVYRLSTMR